MKKNTFLVVAIGLLFAFSANAAESWIVTNEGRIDCQQVHMGFLRARIVLQDGQTMTIPFNQISSYGHHGKEYTRLCLYREKRSCNTYVFMEKVKEKGELTLYRYMDLEHNQNYVSYYVYKGDAFCYGIDESHDAEMIEKLLGYFGLRAVLKQ